MAVTLTTETVNTNVSPACSMRHTRADVAAVMIWRPMAVHASVRFYLFVDRGLPILFYISICISAFHSVSGRIDNIAGIERYLSIEYLSYTYFFPRFV